VDRHRHGAGLRHVHARIATRLAAGELLGALAIEANTAYVTSYWSPKGYYADDAGYFATSGIRSQMLYAPPDGQYGPNGSYAARNAFPASSANASNYWVDLVFTTAIQ